LFQLVEKRDEDGLDALISAHDNVLLQLNKQCASDQFFVVGASYAEGISIDIDVE
jgi:hypothetical protein